MADSVSSKSQSNSQDLADIAESYRRRRQEIVDQNEEALRSLKDDYQKKESQERNIGDAAVNHIRKETQERVANARDTQSDAIENESKSEAIKIKTIRSKNISQEDQLKGQRDNQEKYYNDLIAKARQEKARAVTEEFGETKKFQDAQSARRSAVEKDINSEVNEVQHKGALEKAQVLAGNRDELNKINQDQRQELKKTEGEFKNQIKVERDTTFQTIKHQREAADLTFQADRDRKTEEIANLKTKLSTEYRKTRDEGDQRINTVKKADDKALRDEVNRSTKEMQITRQKYDDEIKQVHNRGRTEVDARKDDYVGQLQKEDIFYKGEIEKHNNENQASLLKNQDLYRQKLIEQDDLNKKSMATQGQEFQRAYAINEKLNSSSIHEQKDRYIDAVIKQKQNLTDHYGKYDEAKDDPFYKMHEFETRIAEDNNFYTVKTKVPPHEKHNVDVIVKNDRVVVSGQRQFADKVNKDGRSVETNSQESFREEIPLKHPAVAKAIDRRYEDGHIVIKIPKVPIG